MPSGPQIPYMRPQSMLIYPSSAINIMQDPLKDPDASKYKKYPLRLAHQDKYLRDPSSVATRPKQNAPMDQASRAATQE